MPDPYRIDERSGTPASGNAVRVLLWTVLVVSAAANAVASLAGMHTLLRLGAGSVTVLCVILLIVHHVTRRRR